MYDKFIRNNAPISDPMKHPHLSKVLKIDGMPTAKNTIIYF